MSALNTKAAEAKELAPTVTEHEAYKSKLEALKPTVAAVAPVVTPKEEKAEAKEEKKDDKVEKKAEKEEEKAEKKETKKRTSRSASRKRTSIFGAFGKKDEAKKEEVTEAAPVAPEAGKHYPFSLPVTSLTFSQTPPLLRLPQLSLSLLSQ